MYGDSAELLSLVRSGQISANEPLDNGFGARLTPFCIMVITDKVPNTEISQKINEGASLSQNCAGFTPLEQVAHSMFTSTHNNQGARNQLYVERARLLVAHGGMMNDGSKSMDGVFAYGRKMAETLQQVKISLAALEEENRKQAAKDNIFSAENIGATLKVVAGAVNAYTAAKYGNSGASALISSNQIPNANAATVASAPVKNPVARDSQVASAGTNNAATTKASATAERYLCDMKEYFTQIARYKQDIDQACGAASQKAASFVAGFGRETVVGQDTKKLKSIDSCKVNGTEGTFGTAVVTVHYSELQLNPCGRGGGGVAR